MTIDFHIHTYHSYDCSMKPEKIIAVAKSKNLDGIVVSDHDTVRGGIECQQSNKDDNFIVITGAEIATEYGDITGLFLKEEINSRRFREVVQEIKNQSGLILLNHPFKHHELSKINFDWIDLIEGFNSRLSNICNMLAINLARKKNIPIVGGSDAHFYFEIGNCKTYYQSNNILKPMKIEYTQSKFYAEFLSQIIKINKKREYRSIFNLFKWAVKSLYKRTQEASHIKTAIIDKDLFPEENKFYEL